jgi:hypothetical protein
MRARIQDAREDWQAAQLLFDAELARVMRLLECPRYLLWWEHLRVYLSRDGYTSLSTPAAARQMDRMAARGARWKQKAAGVAAAGSTVLVLLAIRLLVR